MHHDLNMAMMRATFKLEQRQDDGTATVGTGWLVSIPDVHAPASTCRTALVTAGHVFKRMAKKEASIHWRREDDGGVWRRELRKFPLRQSNEGAPLWTEHPDRDVAVMWIDAPEQAERDAIPIETLADENAFVRFDIRPADEMMALGYPRGITANEAGFSILRSGRVASYPLWPTTDFPTFLMDFSVFAGNSGGPVYMAERNRRRVGSATDESAQFVAGLLAQQVMLTDERLEIGIVLHAVFIREALALLQQSSPVKKGLFG